MKCEKMEIKINTEFIRLDAFLKFAGEAETGGQAKIMISERLVTVNGEICEARGKKLYPGFTVGIGDKAFEVVGG